MTNTVEPIGELISRLEDRSVCSPGQNSCRNDCRIEEAIRALSAAEEQIADLKAAKILEMNDEQVVALLGGHDAAEDAARHADFVMRSVIEKHALQEENKRLREALYDVTNALHREYRKTFWEDEIPEMSAQQLHDTVEAHPSIARARNALNEGKNDDRRSV